MLRVWKSYINFYVHIFNALFGFGPDCYCSHRMIVEIKELYFIIFPIWRKTLKIECECGKIFYKRKSK